MVEHSPQILASEEKATILYPLGGYQLVVASSGPFTSAFHDAHHYGRKKLTKSDNWK